jgi:hypothetical protein
MGYQPRGEWHPRIDPQLLAIAVVLSVILGIAAYFITNHLTSKVVMEVVAVVDWRNYKPEWYESTTRAVTSTTYVPDGKGGTKAVSTTTYVPDTIYHQPEYQVHFAWRSFGYLETYYDPSYGGWQEDQERDMVIREGGLRRDHYLAPE